MSMEDLAETLGDAIQRHSDSKGHDTYGEYGPSKVSGCPLKGFLDELAEIKVPVNRWTFSGSAVHYYLQEHPDLLPRALRDAGFHPINFTFEVNTHHYITSDVRISGTADVLAHDENGDRVVLDLKYSSIPPHSGHGRIYMYLSQVNAYGNMFNADKMGLVMINSRSDNIPSDIGVISGDVDNDNWQLVKQKTLSIHDALEHVGYPDGVRYDTSELEDEVNEFWDEIMEIIPRDHCPSYEKECQYCDHSDYCPVANSGLRGMGK